jgi:uncharacterized protein
MTRSSRLSHVIGFDDAPFDRAHRGDIPLVGVVFAGLRLEGVVRGTIRRDGSNAARVMAGMIAGSRFAEHLQLILLQGIAVGGFNVVDVFALHRKTGLPVLVIARRQPDMKAIRSALTTRVRGGLRKWRVIERLGAMEPAGSVRVQRVGISLADASAVVQRFAVNGFTPEPLRVAHLVAGAFGPARVRSAPR